MRTIRSMRMRTWFFLAFRASAQGHGVGSAILKQTLAPLDARGSRRISNASTERNVALYERHGFEVTGEFDLPGLHFWTHDARASRDLITRLLAGGLFSSS